MADNKLFKRATFTFVGTLAYGETPLVVKKLSDTSKWSKTKLNLGIKNGNNVAYPLMEYIHSDSVATCKLFLADGSTADVLMSDTPNYVDKVADYSKIVIDLEEDFENKKDYMSLIYKKRNHEMKKDEDKTKEDYDKIKEYDLEIRQKATKRKYFCHIKDAIAELNKSLPYIGKEQKVMIKGSVKVNYYNNKSRLEYIPSSIELVSNDTAEKLEILTDFFFDNKSLLDDKENKRVLINGYVGQIVKKKELLYNTEVILDYKKIDTENETHMKMLNFLKDTFEVKNKKYMHKIKIELQVINGREQVEFSEECLTAHQKMMIELGMSTVESFKPKGGAFGDRIQELRLIKPIFVGEFENGAVESIAVKDIGDYMPIDDGDVNIKDVKKEDKKEDASGEIDFGALFGN